MILLVAAAPKVRHPDSFETALVGYQMFSSSLIPLLKYTVPRAEILLGTSLILYPRRLNTLAACLLFAGFTLVLLHAWSKGLALACGCFGRVDQYLHLLPHGLLLHIGLNALATAGLAYVTWKPPEPKSMES